MGAISIITGLIKGTVGRALITLIGQKKSGMVSTKGVLKSKTWWGIAAIGLAYFGPMVGIDIPEESWMEVVQHAMAAFGVMWAGYGRNTATTKIGKATERNMVSESFRTR